MDGAKINWQAGQGDRGRRGGEEGVGLGQHDPEAETEGRVEMERGEAGGEEEVGRVTRDSFLGVIVTVDEAMRVRVEEQM